MTDRELAAQTDYEHGSQSVPQLLKDNPVESGTPLYQQLANILRDEIVAGVHPVGSLLPTEDKMRERFSVSRYTVREALRLLREDGLVVSRRGAGTQVVPRSTAESDIHQVMSINDLVAFAGGTRLVINSVKMVNLSAEQALRTGLGEGDTWLHVHASRKDESTNEPVCITEYFINRDFAAVGRLLHRHTGPIFPLIEDLFGLTVNEVNQQISATLMDTEQADLLQETQGHAALEVRRSYRTTDQKMAQVTINLHPASRYQHSMTMRRVRT